MRAAPILLILGLWAPSARAQDYVGEHLPKAAKPPAEGHLPYGLAAYVVRASGKADPAFDRLVDDAIATLLALDPVHATELGFHQYDALLPDADSAGVAARHDRLGRLEERLRAIDPGRLDARRKGDHKRTSLAIRRARLWGDDPVDYVDIAARGVRSLLLPYAPLEDRASNVISRVNAIAPFLRDARVRLSHVEVSRMDRDEAIARSRDLVAYLSNTLPVEMDGVKDPALREELDHHLAQAAGGAADFHDWLKSVSVSEIPKLPLREFPDDPLRDLVGR